MYKKTLAVSVVSVAVLGFIFTLYNDTIKLSSTKADNYNQSNHSEMVMGDNVSGPSMPGQEVFGTIQEVVHILEAAPNTDWSKVDIKSLRQHLIDMDKVTINADVETNELENGLEMKVTGEDRTVPAIKRMVTTHNKMTLQAMDDWNSSVEEVKKGVVLRVTSGDNKEIEHIKGLGFWGLMTQGNMHPKHHLMMAKGVKMHQK